ncbi:MAG: hypothetical protein M3Q29_12640 [Chloroflexota bacterium]|nr:hypothetical protein [Chloroflexota bacterium]
MERDRQTVRPGGVTSEGGVSTGDGVRGQQMRAGRGVDDVVQQMTQVIAPRDRVRWGPIWAGLLSALSLWLLGNVLALAIGASSVEPGVADAGTAARITGWAPPILGLLAFLFGGWVAARTAAVRGTANGVFNGFLVWALGTLLTLALAAFGLGQLLGVAGDFAGQIGRLGRDALGNVDPEQFARNQQRIAENVQNTAWATFGALGLPALASTIGGWLGARKEHGRDDNARA